MEGDMKMKRIHEVVKQVFDCSPIEISLISGGVTESLTARVHLNGRRVIIKTGGNIVHEIEGFRTLSSSCIKPHLPEVVATGNQYLILGNLEEVLTIKEMILKGLWTIEEVKIFFSRILVLKERLWTENLSSVDEFERSMIRFEFPETRETLTGFFNSESELPVRINDSEHIFPSIREVLKDLSEFLSRKPDLRLTLVHGDLKAENILVPCGSDPRTCKFWIIDPEWSSFGDWAEALSRLGKWRSSKYSTDEGRSSYRVSENQLEVSYVPSFLPVCGELEEQTLQFGESFSSKIGDQGWKTRYFKYLTASLLREIVLLERRALPASLGGMLLGEALKTFSLSRE
jgi:serine/threonine protein kinase